MSETVTAPPPSVLPEIGTVTFFELRAALMAGWHDFRRAPLFGLFFAGVYVMGGWVLWIAIAAAGHIWWALPVCLAFPLIGPFAAVGLYEVSRRLEAGEPLEWGKILGVVFAEKDRQLPWMGAIMVFWVMCWMFLAHMIFALFLGIGALIGSVSIWETLWAGRGLTMLVAEFAIGGVFAAVLFAAAVVSLPLMLEREVDFVSAMLISFRTVAANKLVLAGWAGIIAVGTLIGMVPGFLGLFLVLPIFGHATWHLYRRALYFPV